MPTGLTIVLALGGSALISALVSEMVKKSLAAEFKKKEELEDLKAEKQRRERKEDVLATIRLEFEPLNEKIDKLSEIMELGKEGTVTLLRESMKQTRDQFTAQGYASASDVASWHELYNTYKKLGGNHFLEYVNAGKDDVDVLPRSAEENITE